MSLCVLFVVPKIHCYLSVGPAYEKYVVMVVGVCVSNVLSGKVAVSLQKLTMGT